MQEQVGASQESLKDKDVQLPAVPTDVGKLVGDRMMGGAPTQLPFALSHMFVQSATAMHTQALSPTSRVPSIDHWAHWPCYV